MHHPVEARTAPPQFEQFVDGAAETSRLHSALEYCKDIGRSALQGITRSPAIRRALALGLVVGTTLGTATEMTESDPPAAEAIGGERAAVLMPFDNGGKTWIAGDGPDAHHHSSSNGWAADLHAAPGTAVKPRLQTSDGSLEMSVAAITETCAAPNSAGKSVWVNVNVDNTFAGRVAYGHLDNVQVEEGDSISSGDALGYLKLWDQSSCWQDTLADGAVHTHVEVAKGCYRNLSPWTNYVGSTAFGLLSSEYSAGNASVCDEYDVNQVTPSPGTLLVGDVTGDGRADAVLKYSDSGNAYVGASDGNGFAGPYTWAEAQMVGADTYFLGDVDGNGKDDLVGVWDDTGSWYVSLSNGQGFWPEQPWATGHGMNTSKQFIANVNTDPYDDLVTFDKNTGDWWVSLSDGNGFQPPQRWRQGHGLGSTDQLVADFNGDQRADAAVYLANSGRWYVGLSNGQNSFGYPGQWSEGHGLGGNKRLVGDVNGDGRADEAFFFTHNGHWDNGMSSGSGFWAPTAWAHGHGVGTAEQFLADVNNDDMADLITFDSSTGDWWVSKSSGSGFWSPQRWLVGMGKGAG